MIMWINPSLLFCEIIIITVLLFSPHLSLAYEDPRGYSCDEATYYAPNSTFSSNLNLALKTLTNTTASNSGFAATSLGDGNQTVTALALCRATVNQSECQSCVEAAASGIFTVCPDRTVAQAWYTLCMLRYSHDDFLNQADYAVHFVLFDDRHAPDSDDYDVKVKMLMRNLSSTAGVSGKRYAVGRTSAPENRTLYGYVDCTRDVDGDSCTGCLLAATSAINSCCLGRWAGWIATPTCNIQFNMDPVHDDWLNSPPYVDTTAPSPVLALPPPPTSVGGGGGGFTVKIAIIVTVGAVVLAAAVLGTVAMTRRGRKNAKEGGSGVAEEDSDQDMIGTRNFIYDLDALVAATDNFSSPNVLGAGGFGTVYKGRMENGEEVAVKKLTPGSTQGREEFSNEVRLLLKLQHRNLVRLFGCCVEAENRMLVYEYLQNKSLNYFIFDKSKSALLDWPKRYNIIMGVARGLLYLHEDSRLRIIHRDIKASNILLDDWMNPKIADFGLARLFKDEQTHHRTRQIAGTFGYMAPEYAIRGFMTPKIDVFSFGVLILEIISGRKNYEPKFDEQNRELLKLAWRLEQEGRIMELVDGTIGTTRFSEENLLKCVRVGLLCCQQSTQDRPTMSSAMLMLSNDSSATIPIAGRHGYQMDIPAVDPQHSVNTPTHMENESFSRNSITFSLQNIGR